MSLLVIFHKIYSVQGHEPFKKCTRGHIIIAVRYVPLRSLLCFLYQSWTAQFYHQWTNTISEPKTKGTLFGGGDFSNSSTSLKASQAVTSRLADKNVWETETLEIW